MATFGIYVRHGGIDSVDDVIVVRDRFSIFAAIAPVVWALWHRHWLAAIGFVVLTIIVGGGLALNSLGETADTALILGVGFLQGLTAPDIRHWSLTKAGYELAAFGDAPNATAALHSLLTDDPGVCTDLAETMSRPSRGWLFS